MPGTTEYVPLSVRIFRDAMARDVELRDSQTNLRAFAKTFWNIVEPSPFEDNWVVGALSEHLQACAFREIRRLKINIHFRSGKSLFASQLLQAWWWGLTPEERFLYLAHTQRRALHDAEAALKIIRSDKYKNIYGNKYALTKEAVGDFTNDKNGRRISLGAESKVTGEGSGIKVFDDPNDVEDVESPVKRESTNGIFDNLSTRSDNFATDVWILVQQRTHPKDVSGHIEELGGLGFVNLTIPLEYDPKRSVVTVLRFKDPRTESNEISIPSRFPAKEIVNLKLTLNYRYPGQANQDPSTPEGAAIKRAWYPLIDIFDLADVESLVLSYDVGFSENPNADWTWGSFKAQLKAGNHLGPKGEDLQELTLFQHFGKWNDPQRDTECSQFGLRCKVLIDSGIFPNLKKWDVLVEAGVGPGVRIVEAMRNTLLKAGLPAKTSGSNVNKVIRSTGYISAAQASKVGFYRGNQLPGFSDGTNAWINPFFVIVCSLMYDNAPDGTPRWVGEHDDPLDSEAMAHDKLVGVQRNWGAFNPVRDTKK